jgi:hypothetical protein
MQATSHTVAFRFLHLYLPFQKSQHRSIELFRLVKHRYMTRPLQYKQTRALYLLLQNSNTRLSSTLRGKSLHD